MAVGGMNTRILTLTGGHAEEIARLQRRVVECPACEKPLGSIWARYGAGARMHPECAVGVIPHALTPTYGRGCQCAACTAASDE